MTEVGYSLLRSFGNFQHEEIAGRALVEEGEAADQALATLRVWVESELDARVRARTQQEEILDVEARLHHAEVKLSDTSYAIEKAEKRYTAMVAFLERHGVKLEDPDIPF